MCVCVCVCVCVREREREREREGGGGERMYTVCKIKELYPYVAELLCARLCVFVYAFSCAYTFLG